MKRRPRPAVLLVSDLPAWGRVALASAIPIVEAAGYQACCLPTALLSTHGAYPGFVLEPQTEFLRKAWTHLSTLDLPFVGLSIGLVGELPQFPLLIEIARTIRSRGGLVMLDPILGDNGKRYSLFQENFLPALRSLLAHADIVTPNLTEAALLLGRDPSSQPQTEHELVSWTRELSELGPSKVVITSAPVPSRPDHTGVAWFDRETQTGGRLTHPKVSQGYPGTGDAFAARLLVHQMNRKAFSMSLKLAISKTLADLKRSQSSNRPALWGLEG